MQSGIFMYRYAHMCVHTPSCTCACTHHHAHMCVHTPSCTRACTHHQAHTCVAACTHVRAHTIRHTRAWLRAHTHLHRHQLGPGPRIRLRSGSRCRSRSRPWRRVGGWESTSLHTRTFEHDIRRCILHLNGAPVRHRSHRLHAPSPGLMTMGGMGSDS